MRYQAFISYSHVDASVAHKLHDWLERFSPPKSVREQLEQEDKAVSLSPVFLDRAELGVSEELSEIILEALDQSRALVVVCSPAAGASIWVNREIELFRTKYPDRPIYAFVAAGDPAKDPEQHPELAAFPPSLVRSSDASESAEPLAADARKQADGFRQAALKLAASLLGVRYDELRQRDLRRQQQRLVWMTVASLALATIFAVIAWRAIQAEQAAELAREQAQRELVAEQETRAFMLSIFQLADPNEARGNKVTVREVLDRAVRRISDAEFSSALIKAKLTSSMAQAYAGLGLYEPGLALMQDSSMLLREIEPSDPQIAADQSRQRASNQIVSADMLFDMGDYEAALELAEAVEIELSVAETTRLLNIKGDVLSYLERDDEAKSRFLGLNRNWASIHS